MAASMSDDESTWVSLASKQLSARISPLGAQLSALRDRGGLDLLWNGDPAVWSGRAPFLFPIVGALAGGHYRLGARTYALPRHGFARGKAFEVVEAGPSNATFRLKSDESTLAVYPFRFELDIRFEIRESTLGITAQVRNKGDAQMPASFGYHPAFRWPLPYGRPRASHYLEFEIEEAAPIRRLNAQGLLTATRQPTPIHHRRLLLEDALFVDDVIIMDAVKSRAVTYGAEDGPRIRMSYPDTPYLGVWTKPQANFICIEPWHGVADPDGFTGDFTTKPGVFNVGAGGAFEVKTEITLSAGT
jgi:galactose mutarotase-like enzyme